MNKNDIKIGSFQKSRGVFVFVCVFGSIWSISWHNGISEKNKPKLSSRFLWYEFNT